MLIIKLIISPLLGANLWQICCLFDALKMSRKFITTVFLFLAMLGCLHINVRAQAINFIDDNISSVWADSVLNVLTLEEKVGQLFMVEAYSNRDTTHVNEVLSLIHQQKIGGVIFFQGGPERQAIQTKLYQSNSGRWHQRHFDVQSGCQRSLARKVSCECRLLSAERDHLLLPYSFCNQD